VVVGAADEGPFVAVFAGEGQTLEAGGVEGQSLADEQPLRVGDQVVDRAFPEDEAPVHGCRAAHLRGEGGPRKRHPGKRALHRVRQVDGEIANQQEGENTQDREHERPFDFQPPPAEHGPDADKHDRQENGVARTRKRDEEQRDDPQAGGHRQGPAQQWFSEPDEGNEQGDHGESAVVAFDAGVAEIVLEGFGKEADWLNEAVDPHHAAMAGVQDQLGEKGQEG